MRAETYLSGHFSQFDDAQLGAGARLHLLLLQTRLPLTDFELHHLGCAAATSNLSALAVVCLILSLAGCWWWCCSCPEQMVTAHSADNIITQMVRGLRHRHTVQCDTVNNCTLGAGGGQNNNMKLFIQH